MPTWTFFWSLSKEQCRPQKGQYLTIFADAYAVSLWFCCNSLQWTRMQQRCLWVTLRGWNWSYVTLQCKTEFASFVPRPQLLLLTLWWTPSGWSRPGCSWRKSVYTLKFHLSCMYSHFTKFHVYHLNFSVFQDVNTFCHQKDVGDE